jgi:hypothetical protein
MDLTRREILIGTVVLAACGGDDGGSAVDAPSSASCTMNGTIATIDGNHGHTLTIPAADVVAGVERTYDITGTSPHSHMVTVSAANMATLAANGTVQVTSTSGGAHTHTVSVRCR